MPRIGGTPGGGSEFIKPEAPEISEIRADLDRLKTMISQGTAGDGSVDVEALESRIHATNDPELQAQFEDIKEAFQTQEQRTYTSGCSGTETRTVNVDPKILDRNEVQTVLAALSAARSDAAALDTDGDGHLTPQEVNTSPGEGALHHELLDASMTGYENELRSWARALSGVKSSIHHRGYVDDEITRAAGFHAKTPQGQAALTAAYRDLITSGHPLPDLDDAMWDAEKNFFTRLIKHLPLFGGVKEGHLKDKEIQEFLGTDDLRAFTKERYAEIEARTGGPYKTHFLEGKDLEGSDQLNDPDFQSRSYRSGCS
jgi:hypothetical protein